jgi:hypothetical protein
MAAITLVRFILLALLSVLGYCQIQTPPTNVTSGFVRHPILGETQITWYYSGDYVVYDGDVVYGTIADFTRDLINVTYTNNNENNTSVYRREFSPQKRSNSIFQGTSGIWPAGQINYRYADSTTESLFSTFVQQAIAEWEGNVPCLKWNQKPTGSDTAGGVSTTTIQYAPGQGYCAASIGFSSGGDAMLLDNGCGRAEILHEWGHILGLYHEHKRPDANGFLQFVCQNLQDYPFGFTPAVADATCCGASACCGFACQFTPQFGTYYNQLGPANGGAFDLDSVMLYRRDAFAAPGKFTLTNGPNSYQNPQHLSPGDIARVQQLYGCIAPTCPNGCNPLSNTCSFPTAQDCIYPSPNIPNPRAACACRAGYKAAAADDDTTKHWRLPAPEGSFRVWVAEGVPCDTLCDFPWGVNSCQEVTELGAECLHT